MQKIVPNLWFDGDAEQAVDLYTSIFEDSSIGTVARYGPAAAEVSGEPEGSVMTIEFELAGQSFIAINGGPLFKFNESISFMVNCESQEEVDELWVKLTEGGGEEGPCGWLKDRFGLSWQIVPAAMAEMMREGGPEQIERVMQAMLQMKKLDIDGLKAAAEAS